jgi:hypothetical protein
MFNFLFNSLLFIGCANSTSFPSTILIHQFLSSDSFVREMTHTTPHFPPITHASPRTTIISPLILTPNVPVHVPFASTSQHTLPALAIPSANQTTTHHFPQLSQHLHVQPKNIYTYILAYQSKPNQCASPHSALIIK